MTPAHEHGDASGSEPERLPGKNSSEPGGGEQRSELNPSPTDELLEALRPFARVAAQYADDWHGLGDWEPVAANISVGQFRAVLAAIAKHEPKP